MYYYPYDDVDITVAGSCLPQLWGLWLLSARSFPNSHFPPSSYNQITTSPACFHYYSKIIFLLSHSLIAFSTKDTTMEPSASDEPTQLSKPPKKRRLRAVSIYIIPTHMSKPMLTLPTQCDSCRQRKVVCARYLYSFI